MASSKRTCVLHLSGKTAEDIREFNKQSWDKVKECNNTRHKMYKTSKYFAIELPNQYDATIGYHM